MKGLSDQHVQRLQGRFRTLYGEAGAAPAAKLIARLADSPIQAAPSEWSEQDVVLITYGDQLRADDESTLTTLRRFLNDHELFRALNYVHLLPFYPYTSDDGFSVVDYLAVDPNLGDWDDVAALAEHCGLMFDFVLNHCSASSERFQAFLRCEPANEDDFITVDPATDLSGVTRPRSLPLLTEFETAAGAKHVWTTFSADQVDLNFGEPQVLLDMLDVLLFYIDQGAKIIRLDAIAYLWKQIGTSCIHLPQTHEVVKLMRDVIDAVAPSVRLLTETNVPHRENVSYFGDADEAHMVYQFSLAPLLLDAFLFGDARPLNNWLRDLESPPPGCTYFNFTASHDGIGVRPLEGLVEQDQFDRLVQRVRDLGGRVSMKRNADGGETPYELNITYFSALGGDFSAEEHVRRFVSSQALIAALRGIPGVYFHSLVGTPNDTAAADATGHARRINRRKFQRAELDESLSAGTPQGQVFAAMHAMLSTRRGQPAFHPDADQQWVDLGDDRVVAFLRTSLDNSQRILVVGNVAGEELTLSLPTGLPQRFSTELLAGQAAAVDDAGSLRLPPYQAVWLEAAR